MIPIQLPLPLPIEAANDPIFSTRLYRRIGDSRYNCDRWRRTRRITLERDHWLCNWCQRGLPDVPRLDADHIIPASVRPDLFYSLGNLMTLCSDCHRTKTWQDGLRYGWRFARLSHG